MFDISPKVTDSTRTSRLSLNLVPPLSLPKNKQDALKKSNCPTALQFI